MIVLPLRISQVDDETQRRLTQQSLAYRLLYEDWSDDLRRRIVEDVGSTRSHAWGHPDIGANLLCSASDAVSRLYDTGATASHDDPAAMETMRVLLDAASWLPLMQRVQRDTIAIREMLVRVDVVGAASERRVDLRPVYPHEVEVIESDADRSQLAMVRWWRLRETPRGHVWTCEIYDIRPGRERYAVESESGEDVSPLYLTGADGQPAPEGGWRGAAYPYRHGGAAYLPWAMYHAQITGRLWDWGASRHLVDSTMTIGKLWTFHHHVVQTASWPQRYLINGRLAGTQTTNEGGDSRTFVVADPAVMLMIVSSDEADTAPQIYQDPSTLDPEVLGRAIIAYERRAIALAGLNPADAMRVSGDPRSGYAMEISRDGQREAQRRYAPTMRVGDQALCGVVARMWGGLPATGWRVSYDTIPLSVAERIETQRYVDAEIAAGRMTPLQAYMHLHPGLAVEDAQAQLDQIALLREPLPLPPAPPPAPADDPDPDEEDTTP